MPSMGPIFFLRRSRAGVTDADFVDASSFRDLGGDFRFDGEGLAAGLSERATSAHHLVAGFHVGEVDVGQHVGAW